MTDLDAIAARHGVSPDAARHLRDALARGGGRAAQFSHPELGGLGQWSAGGMLMIGDMFNGGLKARVAALCEDLAPLAGTAAAAGAWWPPGLGQPAATGDQNGQRYAYFPETRRLAVESGGHLSLYETGDHRIGGVSQQQGADRTLQFTSQHGPVRLEDLPRVALAAEAATAAPAIQAGAGAPAHAAASAQATAAPAVSASGAEILSLLERLAELHRKGVLTEAEFVAKKTDLLARL
ncbi:SHOCT domain-containing protein [Methylobacterium oryzisoli]|uniref:SHOCT domain-containing protein n=1 Tax=Methylobacterium oryzisoli TaxID=3385502 RepID=UPI0038915124